jgi:hypothetical protein
MISSFLLQVVCALPHTFTTKTCGNASISFAMSVHQHVTTKLLICDTAEFCFSLKSTVFWDGLLPAYYLTLTMKAVHSFKTSVPTRLQSITSQKTVAAFSYCSENS